MTRDSIRQGLVERSCGSCRLYGANFYSPAAQSFGGGQTCCADAVMDLPASFIPNRQTMNPGDGSECPIWEPALRAKAQS